MTTMYKSKSNFYFLLFAIFLLFGLASATIPLLLSESSKQELGNPYSFFITIGSVTGFFTCIGLFIGAAKDGLIIENDRIYFLFKLFGSTYLNWEFKENEIRGFKTVNYGRGITIVIFPLDRKRKNISVPNTSKQALELRQWLFTRYPDLCLTDIEEETQEILQNEDFGRTVEERERQLKKAKTVAGLLNGLGVAIVVWTFLLSFIPITYKYFIVAAIAVPLITIAYYRLARGLVRFDSKKDTVYPTIAYAILGPGIALSLRSFLDFDLYNYNKVWLPVVLIALGLFFIICIGNKEFKSKDGKTLFEKFALIIFLFIVSYGATTVVNCFYDKSTPESYHAQILDKRISRGKYTSYYLELSPWGSRTEAKEITVSEDQFNSLHTNDEVNIYVYKGLLNIPWFVVQ